ncbi:MAG: Nif3-like dinuclear metal center hexameric protein [Flavobacteriales bacterium]
MTVHDIAVALEELAPKAYAEDFDNVGLLVGSFTQPVSKALLTLDCTEEVLDEAITKNAQLIITFHPIIFKGLKSITGKNYVERVVLKAIKHCIAIYAIHTNLDFAWQGSNKKLCHLLGLSDISVLIPKERTIKRLAFYIPTDHAEKVRNALFKIGAGSIGNYTHCSFNFEGIGSFKGNEDSDPVIGKKGNLHYERETAVSITFPWYLENQVVSVLKENHPYEEVAYEIFQLDNTHQHIGIGMYGKLSNPMEEKDFLQFIKEKLPTGCIRHSNFVGKKICTVAVLGGSGSFGLERAKQVKADAYISGDFKYHDFFTAENQILICDIGHYESEQFIKSLLFDVLTKKITNFAFALSEVNTNPVNYY